MPWKVRIHSGEHKRIFGGNASHASGNGSLGHGTKMGGSKNSGIPCASKV